ncbi:MAG: hypothetical protein ABIQ04_04895 [Candidatus Saccharimonadales bacterium]
MSPLDVPSQHVETPVVPPDKYISPAERIISDSRAQKTFADFMWIYVGHPDVNARRRGHERPPIPVDYRGASLNNDPEMFTGYSGLGELVHIRVNPQLNDVPEGYFIAMADIGTGELYEPAILDVDQFHDPQAGPQTIIYLDTANVESLPIEYSPRIHLCQHTQRFTYIPGPDRASSLLHPIESLYEKVTQDMGRQLGQRAFTLITNIH